MRSRRPRVVAPVAMANLRGHRVQAVLIALTLAACGALLTLGLAAQGATSSAFGRLWHETNGADLWLYLDADRVSASQVEDVLRRTPGVRAWNRPTADARIVPVGIVQSGFGGALDLREWSDDPDALARPAVVSGRLPSSEERDAVALDRNVAETLRLRVGDVLRVPTPGGIRGLRVVGLVANAENCAYPLCAPQKLYVARGTLAELGLLDGVRLAVPLRADDPSPSGLDEIRDSVTAALPAGAVGHTWTVTEARHFAEFGYGTQTGMLLFFAFVAAIAGCLLIVVAIGGAVRADSRRIGLLKAVGFTTRQLRFGALAEYVGLAVTGGVVGAALGCAAAPSLLSSVSDQYGTGGAGVPLAEGVVSVVIVAVLTAAVVVLASRRAVRLPAATALRSDTTGATRAVGLLRGPVVLGRALGVLATGRARAVLTAMALAVAAGALVMAMLMQTSMDVFLDELAFHGGRPGDLMARAPSDRPDDEAAVLRSQPGVAGVVHERYATFTLPGSTDTLNLRLRGGDHDVVPQPLVSGRQLQRAGEAVVGYGLAKEHGIEVGRDIELVVKGVPRHLRVVGVNREVDNLGQMATTLPDSVADVEPFDQTRYFVRLHDGADAEAIARRVRAVTGGLLSPGVIDDASLPPILRSIRPVIASLAVVLALLTALGVFNAVLLDIGERRRELGLARALGMDGRQVLTTALTSTAILAVVGCLAAMPVAIAVGRAVQSAIFDTVGAGPMKPPVTWPVLAVGPAVLLVAVLGAFAPAWSASRTTITAGLQAA